MITLDPLAGDSISTNVPAPDNTPPNPLQATFDEPWRAKVEADRKAREDWHRQGLDKLHAAALDPDKAFEGQDFSWARNRGEAQQAVTVDSYLALFNEGETPDGGDLGRQLFRDQIAEMRFGGRGVGDDAAFFAEIRREAAEVKGAREISGKLAEQATIAATAAAVGVDAPASFEAWKEEVRGSPGYRPEREADYLEAWHEARRATKDAVVEYAEPLGKIWQTMTGKADHSPLEVYREIPEDERGAFMDSLATLARALPAEEQRGFWENLLTQSGRDIAGIGQAMQRSLVSPTEEFEAGMPHRTIEWGGERTEGGAEGIRQAREAMNFRDDINRVRDASYDPIKKTFGDWSVGPFSGQDIESGIYAIPGAITTTAVAMVPYAGQAATYSMLEGAAYSDMRHRLMDGGMSDAEASDLAQQMAGPIGALQYIPERIGIGLVSRRVPALNKVINTLTDRITSPILRGAATGGVVMTGETLTEHIQDVIPAAVQDIAGALSQDIPEVDWNKEFEGFWSRNTSTMVAVLPLALFGAAGGLNREARIAAFKQSPREHREAIGWTKEANDQLDAAKTPSEIQAAINYGMQTRLPQSEVARVAVEKLQAEIEAATAAQQELKESAMVPSVRRLSDGSWVVSDAETGAEVGRAPDSAAAFRMAQEHSSALAEMQADAVAMDAAEVLANNEAGWRSDALETTMQAADAVAEQIGGADSETDLRLGVEMDTAKMAALTPENAARAARQILLEDRAAGGDGKAIRAVWGQSTTELADDVRRTINRVFAGGSVLTVFHEKGHEMRRKAYGNGAMTLETELSLYQALDQWLGSRVRRGQELRFVPANFDTLTEAQQETVLDEAFSMLLESEIIRSGRDSRSQVKLPRGVFSRNIKALAKLMDTNASRTWQGFMKAIRHYWGLVFSRAKALDAGFREGKLDREQYDAFLGKMLGLDQQDGFNRDVLRESAEITGETETAMSLGPAAMTDALAGEAVSRIRDPKQRMAVFQRMADKLAQIRRLVDERGVAFNFDAFGKPYEGEISSEKEQILNALAMLDGIIAALPIEERGRIGRSPYTQLAKLNSNEKRLAYLKRKMKRADKVVENWMRKEYDKLLKKLFERAKPPKGKPGEKPKGKAGADIHALFAKLKQAQKWTAEEAEAHAAALELEIAKGEMTAEQEAHATLEANLVRMVGDWQNADAARRAAAVQNMTRVFDAGYAKFKLEKLLEKEDWDIARKTLVADTGKAGTAAERDAKMLADNGLKGRWKDVKLGLLNFEQAAHYVFGENSAQARRLVDMERVAAYQKDDALAAKADAIEDLFTQLAGTRYKGTQLQWQMGQKSMKIDGRQISELEAITATLMWRQEDGRRHMEGPRDDNGNPIPDKWSYDQSFIDRIEDRLSDEAKVVREYLAREYAGEWATLNPIFRQLNGIDLPRHDNYSPITVKPVQAPGGQTIDPVTGSTMSGASTTPGSLKTRGSAIAEPDFRDALQVFVSHGKQMEHWKAYAPLAAEARAILGNREVGNAMEAAAGQQAVSVIRGWLDFFAQGGNRDAAAHLGLNQMLGRMTNRAASIALVGRLGTLAIQSTQLGAALAEMPTGAYLKRMGMLMTGNLGWHSALRSDYIQRRLAELPPIVRQAVDGLRATKPNRIKHAAAKLGTLIGGADALFTAGTFAIVYDYQLSQAAKLGLKDAEARAYAKQAAERATDRIAQPTRPGARSLFEVTSTNPFARLAWNFASDARKNLALVAYAVKQKSFPDAVRAITFVWIINGVMAGVIRNAWRDARDDEDDEVFDERHWDVSRMLVELAFDPIYGLPVLGSMIEAGAFKAAGEWLPEGNLFSNFERVFERLSREEMMPEDFDAAMKDVELILSGLGVTNDTIAGAASLSHLVRDISAAAGNVMD